MVAATHIYHPGIAGNYPSVPDAAYWPTAEIDIRWVGIQPDYTPGVINLLVAKLVTSGDQRTFRWRINATGKLQFAWFPNGTAASAIAKNASDDAGFTDGTLQGYRVTFLGDDGASDIALKFGTLNNPGVDDPEDHTKWTQLGTILTNGATSSLFNSTAPVEVGAGNAGTLDPMTGETHRLLIYDVIDGVYATDCVLDIDPPQETAGATSFTEESPEGATVTINQDGGDVCELIGPATDGLLSFYGQMIDN